MESIVLPAIRRGALWQRMRNFADELGFPSLSRSAFHPPRPRDQPASRVRLRRRRAHHALAGAGDDKAPGYENPTSEDIAHHD